MTSSVKASLHALTDAVHGAGIGASVAPQVQNFFRPRLGPLSIKRNAH